MHTGLAYHEFVLASPRDSRLRARFQDFVARVLPAPTILLDFGAGTGIDAKHYAALGHRVYVYEPDGAMRHCLRTHCGEELAGGQVVETDIPPPEKVRAVMANFAVFNLIEDHRALFRQLSETLLPGGFVMASLLNPYYLGDAKYRWWQKNLGNLLFKGRYAVGGERGAIYRIAPRILARDATPQLRLIRLWPRGPALTAHLYMFMLFQKR